MKSRFVPFFLIAVLCSALPRTAIGADVVIESVSNTWYGGQLYLNYGQHTVRIRLTANYPCEAGKYYSVSNAFEIYTPVGTPIEDVQGSTLPSWESMNWFVSEQAHRLRPSGSGTWVAATPPFDIAPGGRGMVGFMGGAGGPISGMPFGFDAATWEIDFSVPYSPDGGVVCITRHISVPWVWAWEEAGGGPTSFAPGFTTLTGSDPMCLEVSQAPNFPPAFTNCVASLPVHYGETFQYDFNAEDPDFDPLTFELLSGPGSISASTGVYTFTPQPEHRNQDVPIAVCVGDPYNYCGSTVCNVTLEVDDGGTNNPPSVTNCPASIGAPLGQTVTYDFNAHDPEGDSITFSSTFGYIDRTTGVWSFTPTINQRGQTYALTVCATDQFHLCSSLNSEECQTSVIVSDGSENGLPSITNCPSQITIAYDGAPHMFDFNAVDPEGEKITYSKVTGPGQIHFSTGVWTYTPSPSDVGKSYQLQLCAMDDIHVCSEWADRWCTVTVSITSGGGNTAPTVPCTFLGLAEWPDTLRVHLDAPTDPDPGDTYHWFVYDKGGLEGYFYFDGDEMSFIPTRNDAFLHEVVVRLGAVDSHGAYGLCEWGNVFFMIPTVPRVMVTELRASPRNHPAVSGHIYVDVLQAWNLYNASMKGFDFLIGYDTASMTLTNVSPGELFSMPGEYEWEQFECAAITDCEGVCPRGLVRIEGTPEIENGSHQPITVVLGDSTVLATLDFQYKGMPPAPGEFVPLHFFWKACSDNRFGPPSAESSLDTMLVSNRVYDYGLRSTRESVGVQYLSLPTSQGMPNLCFEPYPPGGPTPVRFIDFYSVFPLDWRLRPIAEVETITPNPADSGEIVFFTGSGTPGEGGGTVVAYEWRSNIDGQLSTAASFSTAALSPGEHYITLRVRDDQNRWSEDYRRRLTIVPPPNTFVGTDVLVDAGNGAEITFASVTQDGRTEARVMSSGPPNSGALGIVPIGSPEYFDITTSAAYAGQISVCLVYDESDLGGDESELRLLHYEDNAWVDVTTTLDPVLNVICGSVSSFSYFALAEPCCVGRVGDANGSNEPTDEVTLGDIMLLVDAKFISGDCSKLLCIAEADVNQDGGNSPNCDDHVTLGDIMTLVDFLFITGPENATLPECL